MINDSILYKYLVYEIDHNESIPLKIKSNKKSGLNCLYIVLKDILPENSRKKHFDTIIKYYS